MKKGTQTQADRVLAYMETNGGITSLEAVQELGCTRLSARIADIAGRGIGIGKNWVVVKNRFGDDCRVIRYKIAKRKEV